MLLLIHTFKILLIELAHSSCWLLIRFRIRRSRHLKIVIMFPRTNFKQPYETNICTTNILKPFTHQKNVQRKTFMPLMQTVLHYYFSVQILKHYAV